MSKQKIIRMIIICCILLVLYILFIFCKKLLTPRVALIKDDNKYVMRKESPAGFIYYDKETDRVKVVMGVSISNRDNKEHKVTFNLESEEYLQDGFIKSEFIITRINENLRSDYWEEKYIGKDKIIVAPNSEISVTIYATAEYGGKLYYRRFYGLF